MRLAVLAAATALSAGCGPRPPYDGPTVDRFVGRLTHAGQTVSFPTGEKVVLHLTYTDRHEPFGIPVRPDGSFTIGWMPVGRYSGVLERKRGRAAAAPAHGIPGFEIRAGQTAYDIDLGPDWPGTGP